MADNSAPPRAQRRLRAFKAIVLLIAAAWMIDHRGCVHWIRPDGDRTRRVAYIHHEGGAHRLSWRESGSCGTIAYITASQSNDRRLFNTWSSEWRWLAVSIDGRNLSRAEVSAWRPRAADVFMTPAIMLGDVDEARRFRMGYPLEIFAAIAQPLAVLMLPLLAIGLPCIVIGAIVRDVANAFDPVRRRRAFLQKGVCPVCRYSLRGLPQHRCPECGERWRASELEEISTTSPR